MKSSALSFTGLVLITMVACNNKSGESLTDNASPVFSVDSAKSIILANNLKLNSLLAAADTSGWAGMFTADGCTYPAGMPKICGRDAISSFMGYAYRQLNARGLKVTTDEVLQGDGFFVEVGSYEMYNATGTLFDKGKTMVLWKQEDGTLKVHRDFFNSDLAAAPAN